MAQPFVLASGSPTRARLLRDAGVTVEVQPAPLDEGALRAGLVAEGIRPRDMADALAEAKALRIGAKRPEALVLGADQILELDGEALGKPSDAVAARARLAAMAGRTHRLHTAAVLVEDAQPTWRHLETVTLHMRSVSEKYLDDYLARNWPLIGGSAGAYLIEGEGARLFHRVDGDFFSVLGLPLLAVLSHLALKGAIET